ncbi:SDR family oxidoreductase [Ruegeria conchae]|uniref:3-oxoacyl-[acyl-carrier protein] reductase n=1 Tax=Ruegeria conchae TaxID=981384 RepID=A0A497ZWG7_9RHOB|nr:SDR family oxidoreductase [Ruegeria conchae]RLK07347.1 3-oxoacyl-[acyl-carrier protein] reductase [Ruegeria conchae]
MTDTSQRIREGIAVVTGAGAGLGRELCRTLIAEDIRVAGIGRNPEQSTAVATELGDGFMPVTADVSDPEAVARAFEDITATLGAPTILINNAAVYPRRDILDETPESFMQSVNINLGGVFYCCHAVLPGMVERGYGRIVNLSTFAHIAPAPTAAAYSVTKGAAQTLTKSLIADLADRFPDIVINDWIPGALKTRMGIPDGIEPAEAAKWGVRLALWHDPMLTGRLFDQDTEFLEPISLKRKILNKITGKKRIPLRLS